MRRAKMAATFAVSIALLLCFGLERIDAGAYSVRVDALEMVCFGFENKKGSGQAEFDIQVNGGDNADISWKVLDPNGEVLREDHRVNQANYDFNVTMNGDYKVCLDNSFSDINKIVTLGYEHELPDDMQLLLDKISESKEDRPSRFVEQGQLLMMNAEKLLRFHEILAAKHRRHYHLVSSNLSRVNGFSLLSIIIMIGVGVLQVFIVKRLFEDGSRKPFRFW